LLCVSIQDPSQRVWPDEQEGFPGVFVVAGISVVMEAPEIPDVPGVTGTSGAPGVCPGAGDTGGWDVSVHAETRISAKSNPNTRIEGILKILFIIGDIMVFSHSIE
jgi:hypothetical protein